MEATPESLRREILWVDAGAVSLAAIAGFVNVVALDSFSVAVSHMTGAISRLSMDLASANTSDLLFILSIVVGFVVGAAISGFVVGAPRLESGRRYGVALVIEGAALILAAYLLPNHLRIGLFLAAMACGAQNAMASSYYGLILRTTHLTGIITDLGLMIGHWIRHREIESWKVYLLLYILVGFFAGGLMGQLSVGWFGNWTLVFAGVSCLVAGIGYFCWRHYLSQRPEQHPTEA